ncbi:MAG TPA: GTPase Era [Anaerolineae bacterium]|nr:GTPase Era [Anaerolineae bacterium]
MELLIPEELPASHRSGFVAVVGKPNVGKSTLVNAYLGEKIAIVSDKPQTTRDRLLGILTLVQERGDVADAQIVFVDTPGIHKPLHKLGEHMVDTAVRAIPDADVVLFLVDGSRPPGEEDQQIARLLAKRKGLAILLVVNKGDLIPADVVSARVEAYQALGPFEHWLVVSALRGDGLPELMEAILQRLPLGPRYFPEEQVTDQHLRFLAGELVREQVLRQLREEVPHAVAVVVDEFKERSEDLTYIAATLLVERDTHKLILLGRNGAMIKKISQGARLEIEKLLGTRVYLELWVKVRKLWRSDEEELERLGYGRSR